MGKTVLAMLLEENQTRIKAIPGSMWDADDLFGIVSLACIEREDCYENWSSALVMKIAWNRWHDMQRRNLVRKHERLPLDVSTSGGDSPSQNLDREELAEFLHRRLRHLPYEDRVVIYLRFWKDMSFPEIARATRCELEAIKTRFKRALAKLRQSEFGRHRC